MAQYLRRMGGSSRKIRNRNGMATRSAGGWTIILLSLRRSDVDDRTWVDNAGRPHSGDLRIEERFHRVNHDRLEITVTLTDPKFYSKPWEALDKFPMTLAPDDFHVREMICSPSEYQQYLKNVADPAK